MKFTFFIFLLLFVGFSYSQDGLPAMVGNYDDLKFIPPQVRQENDFTFVRLIYNGRIPDYIKNWYTDYPKGDETLVTVIKRLTNVDVAFEERAIPINHPDLFNYPMIYVSEPEQMVLDKKDALRLREYFLRGGFLMADDFWGIYEWSQFEENIKKIFPDREIVELSVEHPIFHNFYDIEEVVQVPNIGYVYCGDCTIWENGGITPYVRGIFDDKGRLIIAIYFNTDTMDALEWADDPLYPHKFSAYAYKIFINTIIYAMTH